MVASNISNMLPPPLPIISTSSLYFIAFAYVSLSETISDRSLQRGRLQNRLTAAILVITIPLLLFTPAYLLNQTSDRINQDSLDRLRQSSESVASTVGGWLDLNTKALEQLVKQPGIISMDPKIQKPILESMDQVYDYMYLISTTDQYGVNVARSDDSNLTDYGDRSWFLQAIQGDEIAFQTLIGRTSGEPALVVSRPIFSESGKIIGVGMFASDLNTVGSVVGEINIGETGTAFVVDPKSLVVAHTNPEFANQLTDFSLHPAVVTMRKFGQEITRYRDQDDSIWIAASQELENGWAVVVEQKEDELLASTATLQIITWVVTITGGLLSGVLTWLAIRQAIFPINSLTETATAITKGDLTRVAPIESDDEIGFLAQAFNQMTAQLLDLISNLELRISERTQILENRSDQLEAAAEVGRITSSILDLDAHQRSVQSVLCWAFLGRPIPRVCCAKGWYW
jgi:HAMP domain-containing protein